MARAKSFPDLVINVGALGIILDVPKFVWTWGCNGGLWNRLLAVEARASFSDCLLEYDWDSGDVLAAAYDEEVEALRAAAEAAAEAAAAEAAAAGSWLARRRG